MHLQPTQLLGPHLGQPGQNRAARVSLDELLGGTTTRRGVGRAPDKVLRRQPQLGLPRCMRALRGHDQQQMAAARTNSLKLGASNRHAHNDDWGCSSSVSERQRQPRPQAAGRQAPQSRWAQR